MKKLTAGIFTVLMGLVTVNAAEAAVASKGYVDEKVGVAAADITALEATVGANKTAAENAIAAAKKAGDDAAAALESYKTTNNAAVAKNTEDIATNAAAIATNATSISTNATAITTEKSDREAADTALDTRLKEVEKFSGTGDGSVAKQIADALDSAKDYTDALANGAVKKNADDIAAMDTAYKAADTTLQGNIDAMDTAYKAADTTLQGNIDTLSGTVSSNKTAADTGIQEAKDAAAAASTAAAQALTDAKAYADQEDAKIESTIGTVPADKTVVGMIAEAQTAATYNDTAIKADIKANADAIDAIEASAYATSGITSEKVAAFEAYDAKITANTSAAAAAQTQADKGVADAATAQAAAEAAQSTANAAKTTADAAIPAPTADCADPDNKCVLTYNNATYVWEVIERGTGEVVE